jgi:hypothetical protein
MVLVGSVDLAALGRIELDALALLPSEFVLDLLEVPPVPDARRPVPPADVELNDVVRVMGNGNPVKIVDQYSARSRRCSSSSLFRALASDRLHNFIAAAINSGGSSLTMFAR